MSNLRLTIPPHPLLLPRGFVIRWPRPLGEYETPDWLRAGLRLDYADHPMPPIDDGVRKAVRGLLRHGGFKPSGRSKPACEFLTGAAERGELGSINLAVDLCNVVSLHAGLPISVVDLDLVTPPLSLEICPPQTEYVFNPSGQSIRIDGLISLRDANGPCAGPVKDSQRSKTHAGTRASVQLIWGSRELAKRVDAAWHWYMELHDRLELPREPLELAVANEVGGLA